MNRSTYVVLLACLAPVAGSARTPDGQTPAEESYCDQFGGAAYGACNAYCEATDCADDVAHASDRACTQLRERFSKYSEDATCGAVQCEDDVYTDECPAPQTICGDAFGSAFHECQYLDALWVCTTKDYADESGSCDPSSPPPLSSIAGGRTDSCTGGDFIACEGERTLSCDALYVFLTGAAGPPSEFYCSKEGAFVLTAEYSGYGVPLCTGMSEFLNEIALDLTSQICAATGGAGK